ncbi:RagB/SusD family nutrient uptake outer membrane protein [Puia sp. P3]|uniref:RagB/SusD family nutrient uptake outer membrane protein n=1 Tax=Puia sp. P3 TaxID=3423952 RepID=UPI003D66B57E
MRDSLFIPGQKTRIMGEAYFVRAYLYYNLVKAFGGVPLVTTPYTSFNADFTIRRSSVDSTFQLIVSDLHQAEALLPQTWPATVDTRGRATRGGAQALLSKVFLSMKNYDSAAANAQYVLNNSTYSLVTGATAYANMFSTSGKNGTEAIFEIQYVSSTQQAHGLYSFYLPTSGVPAGVQPGSYQIAPTPKIVSAFQTGDIRQKVAVAMSTPTAPATPVPYVNKYPRLTSGTEPDILALRLADIILVRAEALNAFGQTQAATDMLNTIRRRAFAQPLTSTSPMTSPARRRHSQRL